MRSDVPQQLIAAAATLSTSRVSWFVVMMLLVVGIVFVFLLVSQISGLRQAALTRVGHDARDGGDETHHDPCTNEGCGCSNPASARFCRRCGRVLPVLPQWTATR